VTATPSAAARIEADVVIVGGGSAGCVVARRLADFDPDLQIVVLEAGAGHSSFFAEIPGMTVRLMGNPRTDWLYAAEADPSAGGRVLYWSGGRMLGGSSAINGLVYIRGLQRDYDAWAAAGCTGWSWLDVEPYFRKAEHYEDDGHASLGREGPYAVSRIRSVHPLTQRFVDACAELGLPELDDYNRGEREGAFINLTSQSRGRRSSTGNRYLASGARSANLRIIGGTVAERVLLDGRRAVGVLARAEGKSFQLNARRQVILSSGTVQSPAILMRSGIGPAAQLQSFGIPVVHDAAQVGRNLQDHCGLTISKFVNVPTYNSESTGFHAARHLLNYLVFRRGPLASAAVQAMGWVRSDATLAEPDIHLNWLPYGIDYTVTPPAMHKRPAVSLGICVSRPHSRGEIRLRSAAADDKPIIDHRLAGDQRDVAIIKRGIKLMERIFTARALQGAVVGACNPGKPLETDAALEDFVRRNVGIGYHGAGSCRMGSDAGSVVDPALRVRGIDALRVIDASVMPQLVSGNTNAASIMIGEKGADLVLRDLRRAAPLAASSRETIVP
jgi:choline dehydrogenase